MNVKGFPKRLALVQDRGYAWFILLMSFITHSIHHGFSAAVVGNLTVAHQAFFNIDLQQSSLIGSIHTGLIFLFSPVASVMVKKLGCRITQLFGGICLVLGIGLSALSTEPWHAFLLFGVLAAIGVSSSYVAATTILSQYFNRYRYLAFSVAVMGNFVGNSVWPVGSQYLLDKYGYSKAMGIMSAAHVLHIVAGISFIPIPKKNPSETTNCESQSSGTSAEKIPDDSGENQSEVSKISDGENTEGTDLASANQGYDNEGLDASQVDIKNLPTDEVMIEDPIREYALKESFVVLLKKPKVWALMANGMLWNATNTVFYVLINDYISKRTTLNIEEVSLGITFLGISKIIGSLTVVVTSSLKYDRLMLHFGAVIVYASATIAISFSTNKVMYYGFIAVWGVGQGATIANLVAVISDFCGPELLAVLFGIELLAEGVGSMALTPLFTYIGVTTNEQYSIILAGVSGVLGSLIFLPVIISNYRQKRRNS